MILAVSNGGSLPFLQTFRRMAGRICASKYNGLQRGLKSVIIEKRFQLCKGVIMKSKYFIVLFTVGLVITNFSGTKCARVCHLRVVLLPKSGTAEIVVMVLMEAGLLMPVAALICTGLETGLIFTGCPLISHRLFRDRRFTWTTLMENRLIKI